MSPIAIVVAAALAIAIVLIAFALAGAGSGGVAARIERYAAPGRRQREQAKPESSASLGEMLQASEAMSQINKAVERQTFGANMARDLARADLHLRVSEYLAIIAGCTFGIPIILLALSLVLPQLANPIILIVGGVVGFSLPRIYVGRRKKGRVNAFNKQLPDTITLIANALRAGSSFLQAIELVTREARPPISLEFSRVIREVNLGLPFDDAMENMVRRVRSEDLELMVTAITIQHQVGGNLAEILDSISFTIRERMRIKGEIKVLTAQQRISGYVVAGLPIGLAGLLFVIAPKFVEPMFQKPPEIMGLPAGVIILAIGGFMMFIGFMIIRRIVDIEV